MKNLDYNFSPCKSAKDCVISNRCVSAYCRHGDVEWIDWRTLKCQICRSVLKINSKSTWNPYVEMGNWELRCPMMKVEPQ